MDDDCPAQIAIGSVEVRCQVGKPEARGDRPDGYMLAEAKAAVDAEITHRLKQASAVFRRLMGAHR